MTRTRFAPSPTGLLHLGNLRAALFNWLLARRDGGRFLLRLDDTDRERSTEHFAEAIRQDLRWLCLVWDEEHRQSDRLPLYEAAADRLRTSGRLYPCWDRPEDLELRRKLQRAQGRPPVYDRAALRLSDEEKTRLAAERPPHWRFRLDPGRVEWIDAILGPLSLDAESLSDPVLIREDGTILYTLASVADDADMAITDVIRGADHVANTAVQIQLFRALGAEPPRFAHHSLLETPDGQPLSKRAGDLSLRALREAGVEPMALLSLLARLGSADPVELRATPASLAETFDLSRFGAAPTKLDPAELPALSAKLLRTLPWEAVSARLEAPDSPSEASQNPSQNLGEASRNPSRNSGDPSRNPSQNPGLTPAERENLWLAVRGNLEKLSDFTDWEHLCTAGAPPVVAPEDEDFAALALSLLPPRPWHEATWKSWTDKVKSASGRKGRALFQPLRRLLTGRDHGPEMAALMPLLRGPIPVTPKSRPAGES